MASKLKTMEVVCCSSNPMKDEAMKKEQDRWRAESDLDTLMRAEQIKRDKPRLGAAISIAKERKKELSAVTDGDDD